MNDHLPFDLGPATPENREPESEGLPSLPFEQPTMPALPFSLDDEPITLPFLAGGASPMAAEPASLPFEQPVTASEPAVLPFAPPDAAIESEAGLPFQQPPGMPAVPFSFEEESARPALPFNLDLDDDEAPLFNLDPKGKPDAKPASDPLPSHVPAMPPVPKAEPAKAELKVPSMPPVAKGEVPKTEAPKVPTVPPAAESKVPSMAPVQPPSERPKSRLEELARTIPDAKFEPREEKAAFEPMVPPPTARAPIVTGSAVPDHAGPPVAKDVSSALAAMKARLASVRPPQAAPDDGILKPEAAARAEALADARPNSATPPEIWTYRVGQSVFREGELTYELLMLMEGIVDIYVGGEKVASLDADVAAGAYLGEIGSLLRTPRTATVKAVTPCKFLVFPDARRLFEEDPEFGIKLAVILAQRLAKSNEHVDLVMRALYRAKVKDEVINAVKGAFQGKESMYVGKKGLFW